MDQHKLPSFELGQFLQAMFGREIGRRKTRAQHRVKRLWPGDT